MSYRGGQIATEAGSPPPGGGANSPSSTPLDVSIKQFLSLLFRHKFVILIPIILAESIALYSYFVLVTYTANSTLIVQRADNSSLQAVSADLGAARLSGLSNLNKDTYIDTVLLYLRSRDFFQLAAAEILESEDGKGLASKLVNKVPTLVHYLHRLLGKADGAQLTPITMSSHKLAGMISSITKFDKGLNNGFLLTVTTSDASLSVEVASKIADEAIKLVTRRDLKQLEEGKNYILQKIDEISTSMSDIEKEMLSIRKRSMPLGGGAGMGQASLKTSTIQSELDENKIKLEQNRKLIESIGHNLTEQRRNEKPGTYDAATAAILQRQLLALEARRKGILAEGVSEKSAQILDLDEEIENTREMLTSEGRAPLKVQEDSVEFIRDEVNPEVRLSLLKKENWYLKTRISAAQRMIAAERLSRESLPEDEQKYFALTKRLEMRYILFGDLSKQLFQMDVNRISIQNRIVLLEKPSRDGISRKPGLFPTLPMAFLLALVLGGFVAFAIEKSDPVIATRKDIPGFNYIYLGAIPQLDEHKGAKANKETFLKSILLRHKLDLPQTIPFKRIRTRLLHLSRTVNSKAQVISVHSAESGDGKSFVTANLAASMAAAGKKVLLIDTDLRKKALSRELSGKSNIGVSILLTDPKSLNFEKHIVNRLQENLDFLPSGPSTEHSTELLNSPVFTKLLNELKSKYDFVFIDNAPFLALPDSEIVAGHSDVVVINVRCGRTKAHDTMTMLDHFLQDGEKPVCIVLNRSKEKAPLYYGAVANEPAPRASAA